MDKLEEAGVKKVVCIAVADPEEVSKWADKVGLTGSKIEVWADTKGAWTRMLGLDVNQYDEPGPRSHRCTTAHVAKIDIEGCSCTVIYAQCPVICFCSSAALLFIMLLCCLCQSCTLQATVTVSTTFRCWLD